jgi:hypothetical protein
LSNTPNIVNVRTLFLVSVYLIETDQRTAAWTRLGLAIRWAQDLGIHTVHYPVFPL